MKKNEATKIPLFVYGSLKKDFSAHPRFLSDMEYVGEFTVKGHLLNLGRYAGLVLGGDSVVKGEVYYITPTRLVSIDHYEGNGHLYQRRTTTAVNGDNKIDGVWAYEVISQEAIKRSTRHPHEEWTMGRIKDAATQN